MTTATQMLAGINTNEELLRKLREACHKAPIPTEEEVRAVIPEICPECWNSVKPDADRCWAAVRALCS